MLSHAHRDGLDALDATADGLITQDDAVARADQLCAGLGLDAASPAHRDLQSAYRQCWDELMCFADADADCDGAITPEEFVDAVDRGMLADPKFVDSAMLVITHGASGRRSDGDGMISRAEYSLMFTVIDQSKADLADAGFDILDRDGDGVISRAEVVDAMRDLFYDATTPEAPGDRVLR
jgi:Ca2+-binding EF-hand superfamily protein